MLLLSGVAGALAFPTTDWSLLAWLWLVPSLCCSLWRAPRAALGDGWLAGTVFFVVLLRWLDFTFQSYSSIPWPVTWLPITALAAYCGLYVGMVSGVVAWLRPRLGAGWALAAAPPLWVAGEWIRGWLMGGFPWGLLGYSQHTALPVIQIAELGGVYAVSLLLVAVNAAIAGVVVLGPRRVAVGCGAVAALLALSLGFGWFTLSHEFGPGRTGSAERPDLRHPTLDRARTEVGPGLSGGDTRHLRGLDAPGSPEQAGRRSSGRRPRLPFFCAAIRSCSSRLVALSRETGVPILVGSIDRLPGPNGKFLNSAFLLGDQGITAKYDKIQLVPFGEYVPLAGLIGFVRQWAEFISDFAPGIRQTVFPLPGAPFGTVICYEVIFPDLFRGFAAGGASFMANITNDAWFGRTSGPWQHLGTLPLRAVENRVAIARAANTGVSALVAPDGRVGPTLPLFERGILAVLRAPSRADHALHALRRLARLRLPRAVCAGAGAAALIKGHPAAC